MEEKTKQAIATHDPSIFGNEVKIYQENLFTLEPGHLSFLRKYSGIDFKWKPKPHLTYTYLMINAEEAIEHFHHGTVLTWRTMFGITKNLIPVGDFDNHYQILVAEDESIYIEVYGTGLYGGDNFVEFLDKAFSTNMAGSAFRELEKLYSNYREIPDIDEKNYVIK